MSIELEIPNRIIVGVSKRVRMNIFGLCWLSRAEKHHLISTGCGQDPGCAAALGDGHGGDKASLAGRHRLLHFAGLIWSADVEDANAALAAHIEPVSADQQGANGAWG